MNVAHLENVLRERLAAVEEVGNAIYVGSFQGDRVVRINWKQ